ncbi:glutamate receptor ionotropic, kainate 2-like [Cherax quadricarinatus]|uniref:glutamate receptor ionotropic, kainate 2-like n=1 Tax=Cherax quadricarinatus TaxID=27406 RepID=UPI00387E658D
MSLLLETLGGSYIAGCLVMSLLLETLGGSYIAGYLVMSLLLETLGGSYIAGYLVMSLLLETLGGSYIAGYLVMSLLLETLGGSYIAGCLVMSLLLETLGGSYIAGYLVMSLLLETLGGSYIAGCLVMSLLLETLGGSYIAGYLVMSLLLETLGGSYIAGYLVMSLLLETLGGSYIAGYLVMSLLLETLGGSYIAGINAFFLKHVLRHLETSWGVGLFSVAASGQDLNVTHWEISKVVSQARRLRQESRCVTMLLASDDIVFLSAFAEVSLKDRLFVWSTRVLMVTYLPLHNLKNMHKVLSSRNAVLLTLHNSTFYRCSVYVYLPYSPGGSPGVRVASWTPQRTLTLTSNLPVFPDKFFRFVKAPVLNVSIIEGPNHEIVVVRDSEIPGTGLLTYTGPIANVVHYLAHALNFTYRYVMPADSTYGTKAADGSWTGMVGMVNREEADISIGPLSMTATRTQAVDFTWPVLFDNTRVLAGQGKLEVDPWSFLLPLTPMVWTATLTTLLLLLPAAMLLSYLCFSQQRPLCFIWIDNTYSFLRILLQQMISTQTMKLLWRKFIFGVWMMATLVLTRSYSGNLMALLAVRHIPQPFQSLRQVIDDPSTIMIWQSGSINTEYLRNIKSGIIREVADLEARGRVMYMAPKEYKTVLNTFVRRGSHVLVDVDITLRYLTAQDFTEKGHCDFYTSREGYLPFSSGIISQKDNPIVPSINNRVMALLESGIFVRWFKTNIPNSTTCLNPPKKFTIRSSLSLANLWGMFVVGAAGTSVSLLVFCLEVLVHSRVKPTQVTLT